MKKITLALLIVLHASPALAEGDPLAGKSTAIICIGCHNSDGNSSNPTYPKLAGQGEAYLIKQLTDFKTGARKEQHMSSMVEAIDKSDIPNLAAWFSRQQRTTGVYDKFKLTLGKQIFHNGINNKGIAACDGCHGEHAEGNPAMSFPALSGQHTDYVIKMLTDFRSGVRNNDPGEMMRSIAAGLSDAEIESLAHYIASLE